jgi:predicted dehydrogenase
MSARIRLGFIGAGWWATSNHMPILVARPDVELVAVCGLGRENLERVCERFGFAHATEDYRELLTLDLDGVVVSSPHIRHFEHARAALQAGRHVMVEKPMTTRANEAWELVNLARQKNLHLLVPYGWNYKPFVEQAARHVAGGAIGDVEHVLCHMASPIRDLLGGRHFAAADSAFIHPDPRTWADPEVAGGGYGHSQLSHATGMLFFLTSLRAASAFALMTTSGAAVEINDAIAVRFENGAIGAISGTAAVPDGQKYQVDVRLFGTEGMLLLDVERERMELRRRDGRDVTETIPASLGDYTCEGPPNRFVDLIQGTASSNNSSGEMAARSVELLDAAYRSAASGQLENVAR